MTAPTTPSHDPRLAWSLLLLRLGVFTVMFVWALDKFVAPDHAAAVFEAFYFLPGMAPWLLGLVGAVQLAIVLGFVAGIARTWTYAAVTLMHLVSTLASFPRYLEPFDNLLFFAAWPMLAACAALFLLRDHDRLFTLSRR